MTAAEFRQRFARALAGANAGDLAAAAADCSVLQHVAPDDPAVLQLCATIALRRGEAAAALDAICRSLATRPAHGPSLLLAGQAARATGNLAAAARYLWRAVAVAPEVAEPVFLLCRTLLDLGDAALPRALANAHARFPKPGGAWQELGLALQRAGHKQAALAAFTAAAAADPALAQAQFGRGLLLRETGQTAPARDALTRAVALAPELAAAWFALGLTCQDLDDDAGAAAAYRSALDAKPDFAEAAVNLGIALQRGGEMAEAVEIYRRAVQIRPDTFGRIAQALSSASTGLLWLDTNALRRFLSPDA